MINYTGHTLPKMGVILNSRVGDNYPKTKYKVVDIFPGSGKFPGMLLEWESDGKKRGQAFTTEDWKKRWNVYRIEEENVSSL